MCEKLYDIDEGLKIFPQLAAALPAFSDGGKTVTIKLRPGVKFNDGTPMNAEAVRFSLDRHLHMKGSNRRSEIELITAIEVVDPLTVRLKLKAPFAPLVATLADRAGMPVSPAQANKLGEKFGTAPVCVGPWSFVERVPQDRIVLEKSAHYFDPGQARFDKLIFRIIPDDNVRLANLRSGDIDFMHRVGAHRLGQPEEGGAVRGGERDGHRLQRHHHQPAQQDGQDPAAGQSRHAARERPARARGAGSVHRPRGAEPGGVGRPVHAGLHAHRAEQPLLRQEPQVPGARRGARRRSSSPTPGLAGGYSFEMTIVNDPQQRRVGEVIQGMAKEAGFNISLRPAEFASALNESDDGKLAAFLIGWSGRVDPDANIHQFHTCTGSLNTTLACDETIDALLNKAREVTDPAQRAALYSEAIDKLTGQQRNIVYLYHLNYIVAFPKNLKGYKAVPDGLIRLKGTSWN